MQALGHLPTIEEAKMKLESEEEAEQSLEVPEVTQNEDFHAFFRMFPMVFKRFHRFVRPFLDCRSTKRSGSTCGTATKLVVASVHMAGSC